MQQADTQIELWLKWKNKLLNLMESDSLRFSYWRSSLHHTKAREAALRKRRQRQSRSSAPRLLSDFYKLCTNCSCSPHGWASCLLGTLGAFLSVALSAEAGLYLRHLCQGECSDRAKLVRKWLLGRTPRSKPQSFEAVRHFEAAGRGRFVGKKKKRHSKMSWRTVDDEWWAGLQGAAIVAVNITESPRKNRQKARRAQGGKHAVSPPAQMRVIAQQLCNVWNSQTLKRVSSRAQAPVFPRGAW